MGNNARIGLLLGAAACLMAVLVDWVVEELGEEEEEKQGVLAPQPAHDPERTISPSPAAAGLAAAPLSTGISADRGRPG